MTNDELNPNDEIRSLSFFQFSSFFGLPPSTFSDPDHSSFVIRHSSSVILRSGCYGIRIVNGYHPSLLITPPASDKSSNKKSGVQPCNCSRDQLPVATAMVRAPNAFPQAMS